MSSVVSSHVKRFVCIKKKDHNRDNYMACTRKCHCLTLNTRTQFGSPYQDRKSRNKSYCREEPWTLEAQDRLAVEQKGNYRKYLQRFRRLHVFVLEKKKQPHNTHEKTYYLWELHVSFRIHESVCNASEVDFLVLNTDEQMEFMELTITMSGKS